jgi:hypothetical protein
MPGYALKKQNGKLIVTKPGTDYEGLVPPCGCMYGSGECNFIKDRIEWACLPKGNCTGSCLMSFAPASH